MTENNPILDASRKLIEAAKAGEDISDTLKYLSREHLEDILVHVRSHRVIFADLIKDDDVINDIKAKIREAILVAPSTPSSTAQQSVPSRSPVLQVGLPKTLPSRLSPNEIVDRLAENLTPRNEKEIRQLLSKLNKEKLEDVADDASDRNTQTRSVYKIYILARAVICKRRPSKSSNEATPVSFTSPHKTYQS